MLENLKMAEQTTDNNLHFAQKKLTVDSAISMLETQGWVMTK